MVKVERGTTNGVGRVKSVKVEKRKSRSLVVPEADAVALPPSITFTPTGLIIGAEATSEDLREAGNALVALRQATAWAWGDWWNRADHAHGDRKAIVESEGWSGPAYKTLRNYGSVARAIPQRSRRRDISFAHHSEVVARAPAERDALLDRAVVNRWSIARLRNALEVEDMIADEDEDTREEARAMFDADGASVAQVVAALPVPPEEDSGEDDEDPDCGHVDDGHDDAPQGSTEETQMGPVSMLHWPTDGAAAAPNMKATKTVTKSSPPIQSEQSTTRCGRALKNALKNAEQMAGAVNAEYGPFAARQGLAERRRLVHRLDLAIGHLTAMRDALR